MRKDLFIILSLTHSEGNKPCFWRPNNAGYTIFPWAAGVYTKEEVESDPHYYNNGHSTLAISLSNDGLDSIGFECKMNLELLKQATRKTRIQRGKEEQEVVSEKR